MHRGQLCVVVLDHHPRPVLCWRGDERETKTKTEINYNVDEIQWADTESGTCLCVDVQLCALPVMSQ